MAALSPEHHPHRHNNVTLTFDLLTLKPNQFILVPKCTNDKSLAKIHHCILHM